jgi:hypothetical protein
MFVFDIETLAVESTSVILSMACTHFEPDLKPGPDELRQNTIFIKLNVEDQIQRLKRVIQKDTLQWWSKQCLNVKNKSLKPSELDVLAEDGLKTLKQWKENYPQSAKAWVWARGNLDQCVLSSLETAVGFDTVFPHYRWRDIRTAVDFLYNTTNGYCKVDYPGFDSDLHITKHDPVDDCILDAMMLMYGRTNE